MDEACLRTVDPDQAIDADIAAITTHVRSAWGNTGTPVNQVQVVQLREGRD